ncbi:hypothetical protein CRENBAI_002664 [Crenichthys baileyi]|uniref:Uncharacterized protein n=1 Tax=Crenichthys baileyi TaxID=28760 RepID=A0AAV9QSJ1_9TELE
MHLGGKKKIKLTVEHWRVDRQGSNDRGMWKGPDSRSRGAAPGSDDWNLGTDRGVKTVFSWKEDNER